MALIKPRMKICKNPSDAEFYHDSNGIINRVVSKLFYELWTRQILKGVENVSKIIESKIVTPGAHL